MEQIVLYLAILAALSGFGMGLINLAGPFLKRRHITLPSLSIATLLRRGASQDEDDDFDLDLDDEDDLSAARDFADSSFVASANALLAPRRRVARDEDDLDEELAGVLDEVAEADDEKTEEAGEEEFGDSDEGTVIYTVSAEAIDASEDEEPVEKDDELSEGDEDEADDEDDEDEDDEDDEDEDDEDEEEDARPQVQTVAAGGGDGDDMMSFFGEAADAGAGKVAAWREDLPDVSIDELLAEARAIRQQIQGTKSNVA